MTKTMRWQPIETAPRDGSSMLLCVGQWFTVGCWHRAGSFWVTNGPTYSRYPVPEQPTHWMPRPEAPAVVSP